MSARTAPKISRAGGVSSNCVDDDDLSPQIGIFHDLLEAGSSNPHRLQAPFLAGCKADAATSRHTSVRAGRVAVSDFLGRLGKFCGLPAPIGHALPVFTR